MKCSKNYFVGPFKSLSFFFFATIDPLRGHLTSPVVELQLSALYLKGVHFRPVPREVTRLWAEIAVSSRFKVCI